MAIFLCYFQILEVLTLKKIPKLSFKTIQWEKNEIQKIYFLHWDAPENTPNYHSSNFNPIFDRGALL